MTKKAVWDGGGWGGAVEIGKEMRGLNFQGGSMGNSCRVLGKGQGTFRMDRERTRYPQEERRREIIGD